MVSVVLLNPRAGRGGAQRRHDAVRAAAARQGIEVRCPASPQEMEHAAREAALAGASRVIAAGGDGAVHYVLNGIAGTSAALGIIPCGSGNDLAVNLGIRDDIEAAAEIAFHAPVRPCDLCRLEPFGRHFACIASFGLDSHANRVANAHTGPFRGTALYVWSLLHALAKFQPAEVTVQHDAGTYRDRILLLVAANASSYGGGMRIAPSANLIDGLLDVVAVGKMTRLKLLWCFPEVFSGRHVRRREVTVLKTARLSVESSRPLEIFADGEYIGRTPARIEVLPGALRIVAPQPPPSVL